MYWSSPNLLNINMLRAYMGKRTVLSTSTHIGFRESSATHSAMTFVLGVTGQGFDL